MRPEKFCTWKRRTNRWRCVQCGLVSLWGRGWRWFHGPWMEDGRDGIVCSDGCEDAMFARWGTGKVPAPHAPALPKDGGGW